ncbi:MAG: DMT family transporter [Nitriliruptoraceae bacterium]
MSSDTSRSPMSRPAVVAWLVVGMAAVSTAAILARIAMGTDPGIVTAGEGAAPALAIAFWRTTLGSLALAPAAWRAQRRTTTPLTRRRQLQLGLAGVALALHFVLFQGALTLTSVASTVTLTTMSPLFVALGGWWLLGERTARRAWAGMAATVLGALLIGFGDATSIALGTQALIGDIMALGAALAGSAYLLAGRRARRDTATSTYAAIVYGAAGVLLLPLCLATGTDLTGFSTTTWLAIAGIVIGPQLLGHTVFNLLLATLPATTVAIAILAEPVGAGLLAWLLLGELPAPLFAVGAPLVLLGVAVVIRANGGGAGDDPAPPAPLRRAAGGSGVPRPRR